MPGEILVDARPLQGASAARGIGTYVRGLLGALAEAPPALPLAVLLDAGLPSPALPAGLREHRVRRRYRGRLAAYEDAAVLGGDLDRARPAVFHATSLTLPARAPCPVAATLHDLIPWAWGGPWMLGERIRYYPGKRLLPRAEAVIAVSAAAAADAVAHARVARERIEVVHEGAGPEFHPRAGAADRVRARWQQAAPYLLFVGALDRRKDPVGLVRAWRATRRAGVEADLLIAGDPGPQAPGGMGGARLLGRVTDDELADLYSAAFCLVFPSRYEGFGLPVLEAMACGCPVVAYDISAVSEIAGGAAALARAGDAPALAREVVRLSDDPDRRSALVGAGQARAASFTWAAAAAAMARLYERLAAGGARRSGK